MNRASIIEALTGYFRFFMLFRLLNYQTYWPE
jgi:hypothetical protein